MYAFYLSLFLLSYFTSQPTLPDHTLACDSHNAKDILLIRPDRWLETDDCRAFDNNNQYPFLYGWYYDEIYYINFKSLRSIVNHGSFFYSGIDECDNWS
jgi:hypothetical protein